MFSYRFLRISTCFSLLFCIVLLGFGCATPQEQAAWEAEANQQDSPDMMRQKMMSAGRGQRGAQQGRLLH